MGACTRCGRKLKDRKSIDREFGPVCYKKYLKEQEQEEVGLAENQMEIDELEGENHENN
ncbi:DUF6011 domain-containing protein [Virgibacillus sp. YIM 98842]|uniref:DUF6011 domain-containing protein n=1 Tax=Virgibacillus sp. YIM 98842 TaxID=2663533 RepID=UPI0013DC5B4D|nr:DUF6011 domain-containing protein [Virgibacillus sp. YIM 98842]